MKNEFNCDDGITLEAMNGPMAYVDSSNAELYEVSGDTITVKEKILRIDEGCFAIDTMEGIHQIVFEGPVVLESYAIDSEDITSIVFKKRVGYLRPSAIHCPNLENLTVGAVYDDEIDLKEFPKLKKITFLDSLSGVGVQITTSK